MLFFFMFVWPFLSYSLLPFSFSLPISIPFSLPFSLFLLSFFFPAPSVLLSGSALATPEEQEDTGQGRCQEVNRASWPWFSFLIIAAPFLCVTCDMWHVLRVALPPSPVLPNHPCGGLQQTVVVCNTSASNVTYLFYFPFRECVGVGGE